METQLIKLEPVLVKIQESLPKMIKWHDRAVSAMEAVTEVNDDNLEEVNELLVNVRQTYDGINGLRTPITGPLDEIKKQLMTYESDLDPSKDNNVSRIRKLIAQHNQRKIDEKREAEQRAAKIKEIENHKVDVKARIKKNLADLIITRIKEVQDGSKKFWDAVTLDVFEAKEKQFMSFKLNLKPETYNACFEVPHNPNLLDLKTYKELMAEVGAEEPFIQWNDKVVEALTPVINEWRAKIPQIKKNLIELRDAMNEAERKRLAEEQKAKADNEEAERQAEIARMQRESDDNIQREAEVDRMQNEFREQAQTQSLEDAGPTRAILKFKDEKPLKALVEIINQCMAHDKFPSIVKKNKDKSDKLDENGYPEYVEGVAWWVDFFTKNCKATIAGTETKEVSKVIVRAK